VPACTACGRENRADARFCDSCGEPVAAAPALAEQRKTVTVVFCDVTGSTQLGEHLDPESLRRVMARYFAVMRDAIESHGGTVEKFIGDAVMAVFGVPVVHEDDALRAVRAAADMRAALEALNEELERDYGTVLQVRIGVNTGEVVAGTEERLATGDAVNVAARLEQAAGPGEILIGPETLRLTRDAVEVERLDPLVLKGKAEPLAASRLVSVLRGAPAIHRRLDAPMVGRSRELHRLRETFSQAVDDRSCQLFTVLGQAGVGKSRLAQEFLSSSGDATVVVGRCVSYGEGITYWPVVEAVLQLLPGDGDAASRIGKLLPDALAAAAITALLGDGTPTSTEETAWAFRKLLEAAASERPIVCVFDDIHWGQPTFLDLVEHVADMSRGAPILLLCLARPELLDQRPAWGGGKMNVTTVLLEPLGEEETDRLIEELVADAPLPEGLRVKIRDSAEGNPLFVEEMLALVQESGEKEIAVPATIHALLAARLDQLEPAERGVLERGSVEGRVFHRGAVQALAPEEEQVTSRLTALVRKELVRPDKPQFPGEDAFRFRHLLIRDAAYEGLPKAARAALHERFASWLEENGRDLVELDEICGYHLEQAQAYLRELGPLDDHGRELARRAADRLLAAGLRARDGRADANAAANLLERASALLPGNDPRRVDAQLALASALIDTSELTRSEDVLEAAREAARELDDPYLAARVEFRRTLLRLHRDPSQTMDSAALQAEQLIAACEAAGDDQTLAEVLGELGKLRMWSGRGADGLDVLNRALAIADRAAAKQQRRHALTWICVLVIFGPIPVEEGVRQLEVIRRDQDATADVLALALIATGLLNAMAGRFEEARSLSSEGSSILQDLGVRFTWAAGSVPRADIELLRGDVAAAERELRPAYELLEESGETGYLSTVAGWLARVVALQGELEEALALTAKSEANAAPDDLESQAIWRVVRASVLAAQGALTEAERLAREAVALLETTDFLRERVETLLCLADVLSLSGRSTESVPVLDEAIRLSELKGDVVTAATARGRRERALA